MNSLQKLVLSGGLVLGLATCEVAAGQPYSHASMSSAFMTRLRQKTADLGMDDSYFANASGLTKESRVTAADLLTLGLAAAGNPTLSRLWAATQRTVSLGGPHARQEKLVHGYTTMAAYAEFVKRYPFLGGKGGSLNYSDLAIRTHVLLTEVSGRRLVIAISGMAYTDDPFEFDLEICDLAAAKLAGAADPATPKLDALEQKLGGYAFATLDGRLRHESREARRLHVPASTTKIITALCCLDVVKDVSAKLTVMASDIVGGSGYTCYEGDEITFEDAIYSMMLPSSNTMAESVATATGRLLLQEAAARGCEFGITTQTYGASCSMEMPIDCRAVFEVRASAGDPALKGLKYSAFGWELDAAEDSSRMVAITAQAGDFDAGGVFRPDATPAVSVLPSVSGAGTCSWEVSHPSLKVYRLTHAVAKNGVADATGTLYGYLDFTHCDVRASQAEVEAALLLPASHDVAVRQDAVNPWQPVDYLQPSSGVETSFGLAEGDSTATTLAFAGHGTLVYEYKLTGGALSVEVDGAEIGPLATPTLGWVVRSLPFGGRGEHSVVFRYTAAGDGTMAAVRNVRWTEDEKFPFAGAVRSDVRTDLREGPVRSPARMEHVLPFAYSSTNWIGDVQGTAARVTITELTGTDADVRTWSEKGATRVLYNAPGEGAVKWHPKKGVWKATFDILGTSHSEEVWFDLRNAIAPGFLLMVF